MFNYYERNIFMDILLCVFIIFMYILSPDYGDYDCLRNERLNPKLESFY